MGDQVAERLELRRKQAMEATAAMRITVRTLSKAVHELRAMMAVLERLVFDLAERGDGPIQ